MKFLTRKFWRSTAEQVLSAGAASYLTAWTLGVQGRFGATFAGVVMLYYLLKCVASEPLGDKGSPMLTKDSH